MAALMLSSFARLSLVRLRYPTSTDFGVTVADYSGTAARVTLTGFWLEPVQSQENNDGRAAVLTGYRVAGPAGVDILSTDHVEYMGEELEVIGNVMRVPSPTGRLASTMFTIQHWEG